MANQAEPDHPRQLGRSRGYTAGDLPGRLRHWHAPRLNRWERLCVTAGTLDIEYLDETGVNAAALAAGDKRWVVPGRRWRVARMSAVSRFELEVHADSKGQAEAPQLLRSDLLTKAGRVSVSGAGELADLARSLPAGERCIVAGAFDMAAPIEARRTGPALYWHPLECRAGRTVALMARARQPFDLTAYLGRDHAVIEAALGEALAGDAECDRWLRATLARHLCIEETLLFPAYLEAGGREAWVRGLENEHGYLRQYQAELDHAGSRRRFLRLLDGHDEKEERVVYPDLLEHLGERADELLASAMICPIREATA